MTQIPQDDRPKWAQELIETSAKFDERFNKLDGRLWTLSLALIGTAWAAIIGACAVVIVRSITGR